MTPASEPAPKKRRPLGRRVLRWVGFLLLGLFALAPLALIGARLYLSDAQLTQLVTKLLAENLAGKFEVKAIRWRLPVKVTVEGVRVTAPEGDEVLVADRLHAELQLLPLLHKTIEVSVVEAEGLSATLVPPPPGSTSTSAFTLLDAVQPKKPSTSPPSDSTFDWTVKVDHLELSDGSAEVDLPGVHLTVNGLQLRGAFAYAQELVKTQASLSVAEIRLHQKETPAGAAPGAQGAPKGEPIDLGPIALEVEEGGYEQSDATGRDRIDLKNAVIRALGSTLEVTAHVKRTAAVPIEGDAEGRLTIAAGNPALSALLPPDLAAKLALQGDAVIRFEAHGSPQDARGEIALEGTGLRVLDLPLYSIRARAQQHSGTATLERFDLRLEGSSIQAHGHVDITGASLAHRLDLTAWNLPVRKAAGRFVPASVSALLPQSVTATASLEGPSLSPPRTELKTTIAISGLPRSITRGAIDRIDADAKADVFTDHVILQPLSIRDGARRLSVVAKGLAPFDPRGKLHLSVQVLGRALGPILARFGVPVQLAAVDLDVDAQGSPANPAVGAVLILRGAQPPGMPPADARLEARYGAGLLTLANGRIAVAGGQIGARGTARILDARGRPLKNPLIDAALNVEGVEIGELTNGAAKGSLAATATVSGDVQNYVAHLDGRVPELMVGGATLTATRLVAHGDHTAIDVELFSVEPKRGGHLSGKGQLRVADQMLDFAVQGRDLPLALVAEAAQLPNTVSGSIALDLTAKGHFDSPELRGNLLASRIVIDDHPVGDLRADVTGDSQQVTGTAAFTGAAGRLDLTSTYHMKEKIIDGRIVSQALLIGKLPFVGSMNLPVDGVAAVDIGVNGTLPYPKAEGSIRFSKLVLEGSPLGNGQAELKLATNTHPNKPIEYQIDLQALQVLTAQALLSTRPHVGGGKIAGTSSTTPPLPFTGAVTAELHDVALEKFIPAIAERGIATNIGGRAKVTLGERAGDIHGSLTLDRVDATFDENEVHAAQPIEIELIGSEVFIRRFELQGSKGSFQLLGRAGSRLDLRANGAIELAFIEPLVPELAEASGTAKLQLDVQGTSAAPRLSGQIVLMTPVDLRPRGSVRMIHLDKADIRLTPNQVQLRELTGGYGSGSFEASGKIALTDMKPVGYDLTVRGDNLPFETPDLLIEANADLRATGSGPMPKISGTVDITRGRYIKQLNLDRFNFLARKPPTDEEGQDSVPSDTPSVLSDIKLDLHAQSTGLVNLKVDAAAFATDVNLSTDLRITGNADTPRIEGRITAEDGYLRFPAAKLPVTGTIDFVPTPDEPLRPILGITAEGDIRGTDQTGRPRDYHVTVMLTGPLKQMAFDLAAPDLDRTEVLSLLITGNPDIQSIAQGGQSDQKGLSSSVVFAGSQLAGPVSKLLENQLRQALNLQLELRTEITSGGFRVVAAKEITRRIRIEGGYGRSIAENQTVASTLATLRLTDRLLFEGGAQTVNSFGETVASLQEGAAGSLALKLRVFGD